MGIIKAPEPIAPVIQAGPSTKRKRSTTSEDIKPDQKAVLAARVKDLEVSRRRVLRSSADGTATTQRGRSSTKGSSAGQSSRFDRRGFGRGMTVEAVLWYPSKRE
jgi:hypothetical protein